jgi:hypothetical protein
MIFNIGIGKIFNLLLIIIFTSFASCQETNDLIAKTNCQILPIHDSLNNDSGIVRFLDKLKKITRDKDFSYLCEMLDSKIAVSYSEALYGKKEFIENWKDSINQVQLWNIFNRIIDLGGGFTEYYSKKSYVLPYMQIDEFYNNIDIEFENLAVVTSSKTYLYDEALHTVIDTLDYEITEILEGYQTPNFTKVKILCNKKIGWISNENIYKCSDYSLILGKEEGNEGNWKIIVFAKD